MRHRKAGRKLGMDTPARKAMLRNMVTSLMLHGQIRTTEAKAKELRRYAEKVITIGKRAPAVESLSGDDLQKARAARVHAIRQARLWVNDADALDRVFGEYADRFRNRAGGYTRVVKAGFRDGDNAPMAVIQLVEALEAESAKEVAAEAAADVPAEAQAAAETPEEAVEGEE